MMQRSIRALCTLSATAIGRKMSTALFLLDRYRIGRLVIKMLLLCIGQILIAHPLIKTVLLIVLDMLRQVVCG